MRIEAFTRYSRQAASTRQRLLQYVPRLRDAGIDVEHHALLDDEYVRNIATGNSYSKVKIARAYFERWRQLRSSATSDMLWVYVELFPYLPPWVDELASSGQTIIYDMDDAFFHHYDESANPLVRGMLGGKHARLLSRAAACTCGNEYLRKFAAQHCPNSIVLPTVVDTDLYRPAESRHDRPVVVGWIGSPTTWPNVRFLLPLMRELCANRDIVFRVVGAGAAAARDRFFGMEMVEWSEAEEVSEVQRMDIGVMPLIDSPFERGKSGYKLVQYMACGLPAVASPVGVNRAMVEDGVNGFLATSEVEWRQALARLIADHDLRRQMGGKGRQLVEARYSLESQAPRLIELLKGISGPTER